MFKLIIVAALSIGLMAFAHSAKDQGKSGKSDKGAKGNHTTSSPNIGPPQKGNKGGGKMQGGSKEKGGQGGKAQGKPFNLKPGKGNDHGGHKPNKSNQAHHGKQGNDKHSNDKHSNGKHDGGFYTSGKNGNVKHYKGKGGKHYDKGHPNFAYVYVNQHGYYSYKNYGQWRSQQAKNKHKHYHPVYEIQAIEGFHLIVTRNRFLYTETDFKINLLRVRLEKKRKANLITVVQHKVYLERIAVLQKRRAALEVNIVL